MQGSSSLERCPTVRTDQVHTADAQTSARTGPAAWSLEKAGDACTSLPVESVPKGTCTCKLGRLKAASSYSRCQATPSEHVFSSDLVREDAVTTRPELGSSSASAYVMIQAVGGSTPD